MDKTIIYIPVYSSYSLNENLVDCYFRNCYLKKKKAEEELLDKGYRETSSGIYWLKKDDPYKEACIKEILLED